MGRDARAGAVGADEIAGGEADTVEADQRPVPTGALEARAAEDRGAGILRLPGHPAQEVGGGGGEERVAGESRSTLFRLGA